MKRNVTIGGTQTVTCNGELLEVLYTASAELYFRPGRLSGPPEDCYPDESDMSDVKLTINSIYTADGVDPHFTPEETREVQALLDEVIIEEELWAGWELEDR